ncbi:MAG: protoporphyrinogen oxidase [Halobacteriales archaeon]
MESIEADVAVVGAGITGLALVHELRRREVDAVAFDSSDLPGGVIRTERVDGHTLDLGPQRTRLTPGVEQLVDELGIHDELREARTPQRIYVYADGRRRVVPLSLRQAVTTDLLTTPAKLRMLLEPLTREPEGDYSVADYLRARFGRQAYERYLGPLYGGVYGSDPEKMPHRYSLARALDEHGFGGSLVLGLARRLAAGVDVPPPVSFDGGMQALPEALHERHEDSVHLGESATGVRQTETGYVVETSRRETEVERVVSTAPADETAALLERVDGDSARRLESLDYNPIAVVHLTSDADLEGYGHKTALGESLTTLGVTYNHALFEREGVYTAYLGGAHEPDAVERDDAWLAEAAEREFEEVTGHDATALHVHRLRMPAYDYSWTALDDLALPPGFEVRANYVSRPGIPGRLADARQAARRT